MTKTEKRLLELCELVDAYFQIEQPTVKKAVESQLKEQTKEITEEIKIKSVRKLNVTSGQKKLDELALTTPITKEQAIAKSKEKQQA